MPARRGRCGACEFETGEYSQSLMDIQRGSSLGAAKQPQDVKILRYHEALLLTTTGNFEGALRKYMPLARGKVPNPELLVGIGLAGLRTPLLPKDVKADQRDLFLAAGNAAFLLMSGDETAAHREFQNLFQRFPTAANAHYLYGSLLFPTEPDQAITEFRRELEISPSNAAAQLMVAWDSLMRNDFPTALAYAEKAESEEPTLPMARLVLGRALVETGNVKGGTELLEKELQLEPDNLEIHFALAKAYSKSGRKEDARRERLLWCRRATLSSGKSQLCELPHAEGEPAWRTPGVYRPPDPHCKTCRALPQLASPPDRFQSDSPLCLAWRLRSGLVYGEAALRERSGKTA
jgi:predicted Zn-dependent protease